MIFFLLSVISQLTEIQKVQICCLETPASAIEKSHPTIKACFQDLCFSAIKTLCQVGERLLNVVTLQMSSVYKRILVFILFTKAE